MKGDASQKVNPINVNFFMSATISFIKCVDLVADGQKISVLLSWIISPQIGIGNF